MWSPAAITSSRTPHSIDRYINDPHGFVWLAVDHVDINRKNPTTPLVSEYRKAIYHAITAKGGARYIGYMKPSGTYVNGQAGILSSGWTLYRESGTAKR